MITVVGVITKQQNTNNNDKLLFLFWNFRQSDIGGKNTGSMVGMEHRHVKSEGTSRFSKPLNPPCSPHGHSSVPLKLLLPSDSSFLISKATYPRKSFLTLAGMDALPLWAYNMKYFPTPILSVCLVPTPGA